jgi:hypothetical protein
MGSLRFFVNNWCGTALLSRDSSLSEILKIIRELIDVIYVEESCQVFGIDVYVFQALF